MDRELARYLVEKNMASKEEIQEAVKRERERGHPLGSLIQVLKNQKILSPNKIKKAVAMSQNLPLGCSGCGSERRGREIDSLETFYCPQCQGELELADRLEGAIENLMSGQDVAANKKLLSTALAKSQFYEVTQTQMASPSRPATGAPPAVDPHSATIQTTSPPLKESTQNNKKSQSHEEVFGFQVGQKIQGKIRIEGLLGQGGMGAVYLGHDENLDRKVAVKVLSPTMGNSEEVIRRFQREAQTAARLVHSNIVQVHGFGNEEGIPYIAMEYVDGSSLKGLIEEKGRLAPAEALPLFIQCAEALQVAHEKGIYHRDIKPDNIFISANGEVKLGDFGLAKVIDASTLTQEGAIMGTPYYMSPEQSEGKKLDGKADIYSLGATLFHALAGKPPFEGDSPMAVLYKHLNQPLRFSRTLREEIPLAIQRIIKKAMAKEGWRRYSNCGELLQALVDADVEIHGDSSRYASVVSRLKNSPRPSSSTGPGQTSVSSSNQGGAQSDRTRIQPGSHSPTAGPGAFPNSQRPSPFPLLLPLVALLSGGSWFVYSFLLPNLNDKKALSQASDKTYPEEKDQGNSSSIARKYPPGKDLSEEDLGAPLKVYKRIEYFYHSQQYKEGLVFILQMRKKYPKDRILVTKANTFADKLAEEETRKKVEALTKKFNLGDTKKDKKDHGPRGDQKKDPPPPKKDPRQGHDREKKADHGLSKNTPIPELISKLSSSQKGEAMEALIAKGPPVVYDLAPTFHSYGSTRTAAMDTILKIARQSPYNKQQVVSELDKVHKNIFGPRIGEAVNHIRTQLGLPKLPPPGERKKHRGDGTKGPGEGGPGGGDRHRKH